MNFKKQRVVLIADPVQDHFDCGIENDDLECPSMEYFNEVFAALKSICSQVIWYKDPKELINHISEHKDDIILSIWSGKHSDYRKSMVPSICESYGLRYVGADPYVNFLSQDKHLTKLYCKEFDIESAKDVHIKSATEIKNIKGMHFPLIIKPNAEGGSNGISQRNVVNDYETAAALCKELLPLFQDNLLAEEYITGTEITVALVGSTPENLLLKQNKITFSGSDPQTIWGLESKKQESIEATIEATDILSDEMKANFIKLFFSFNKVEIIRIDGRIHDGKFYLIELSPDSALEVDSSVFSAFRQIDVSYPQMFERILSNTMDYYN